VPGTNQYKAMIVKKQQLAHTKLAKVQFSAPLNKLEQRLVGAQVHYHGVI
jgi:hypothetical protein